jgi:hypothetical protein
MKIFSILLGTREKLNNTMLNRCEGTINTELAIKELVCR